MNRFCLIALIGLPAVGKTTFCRNLMQMESLPFDILHFCYDKLINFNLEIKLHYKEQRESLLKLLENIIHEFKHINLPKNLSAMKIQYQCNQSKDLIILCDDNHYYRSMRHKLFQLSQKHNLSYCQIYFKCNEELAFYRNNMRTESTKIPNDVVVKMYHRLEIPNVKRNKWEENTLFLDNVNLSENNCNEIISSIVEFLNRPLQPLNINISSSMTHQSKVHELDLLLRKRIQILMSSKQQQDMKLLAKHFNEKKREILKTFQFNMKQKSPDVLDLNKYVEMLI